jgi:hypothetical protein
MPTPTIDVDLADGALSIYWNRFEITVGLDISATFTVEGFLYDSLEADNDFLVELDTPTDLDDFLTFWIARTR